MRTPARFILLLIIFVGSRSASIAQLCTGSLGDPVVNITFGNGSNPGAPLSSNITNYGYVPTSCPGDGFYNIGTSTSNCFGNSWHTLLEDHTPNDANGYMMIINASNNPGTFYFDTVRNLCGGTTYEFAAWITNIIKPSSCGGNTILPNVTFKILSLNGTELLTSQTGNIQPSGSPSWKQYGAFFTTPAGQSTVIIQMINNATGGCGNDLLLDDITFRPCGPLVTSVIDGGQRTKDICVGQSQQLNLSASVSATGAAAVYQWQVSTNNGGSWTDIAGANSSNYVANINATTATTILYRIAVGEAANIGLVSCRVVSEVITININELPAPMAANNGPRCEGAMLELSASGGEKYQWTGPAGFSSDKRYAQLSPVTSASAGKYYVSVTTGKGCVNTDSTLVVVNERVTAQAGPDVSICEGSSTRLSGGTGVTYQWTPSRGLSSANIASPLASPDTTTTYVLAVSNGQCVAYDTTVVTVLQAPVADAGPDKKILQGQSVILEGAATGGSVNYYWTPAAFINNPTSLQPAVSPVADTTYTLHVVSNIGCGSSTDAVFVRVYKAIKAPNAFSPNGDGINDVWQIEALETYPNAVLSVFNRLGSLLYTANGNAEPWNGTYNGKPLPVGTYYYVIDLKDDLPKLSGSISILR